MYPDESSFTKFVCRTFHQVFGYFSLARVSFGGFPCVRFLFLTLHLPQRTLLTEAQSRPTATMDTPRIRQTHLPTILICLLFSIIHIQPVFAQAKCYSMLGSLIKDPGVIPCNPLASNTTGTHSSCCNQKTGDVCLSSGLCLSPSGKEPSTMLWTNGCTDPTWKDRSCPRYCNPPFNSTGKQEYSC